jgi:hypothetical protein
VSKCSNAVVRVRWTTMRAYPLTHSLSSLRLISLLLFGFLLPVSRAVEAPRIEEASDDTGSGSIDTWECTEAFGHYAFFCADLSSGEYNNPMQTFQSICAVSEACKNSFIDVFKECTPTDVGIDLLDGFDTLYDILTIEETIETLCSGSCTDAQADSCQASCGACVGDVDDARCSLAECLQCTEYVHCLRVPKKEDPGFPANATVRLASDGSFVPLSSLGVGDEVIAVSPWGTAVVDRVSPLSVANARGSSSLHRLVVRSEDGAYHTLHLTGSHRMPVGASCCGSLSDAKSVHAGERVWHLGRRTGLSSAKVFSNTVVEGEAGPLFSPVLDSGGLPVVDGLVTSPGPAYESKLL